MKRWLRWLVVIVSGGIALLGVVALAQDEEVPLSNWGAPPYWTPPVQAAEGEPAGAMVAHGLGMTTQAEALPSSPLPFVAITPCRIVDTRVAVSDGFHQPNFSDGETRTFTLPASTDCTGLPATAGAWSLNVQFRPISVASYITLFPTGTTMPTVSTLTASPAAWVEDAAIVPAGTAGAIDVYCQFAGRVIIDINGYYGPQSVVTSLTSGVTTLTGDVTLAQGSNVTITPSESTFTIAATGGPGGDLPAGSANQTLRNTGSIWASSSALTNDGTNVGISGILSLPDTTSTAGMIDFGGSRFIHNYGPFSSGNIFIGTQAGNFTMGGIGLQGSQNTATGAFSLASNTTGDSNTTSGYLSLTSNTTGSRNTAIGSRSMLSNIGGFDNTAIGFESLFSNTTGSANTASGYAGLNANTTGSNTTAVGGSALISNTVGSNNTAGGASSMTFNTTADYNTAYGASALYSQSFANAGNEWPSDNTAIGFQALYSNQPTSPVNGIQNTAVGLNTMFSNTTGFENTAAGSNALYAVTTGWQNTAVGSNAGSRSDTITAYGGGTATFVPTVAGSYNTFLGRGTGATADVNNCTAVGVDAYCTADNQVRLGNVFVNSIGGEVAWSALSDLRAKTDVRDLDLGLDFVMALRPVEYRLKSGNGKTDMGFVAQEIEALLGDGYNVLDVGGDPQRTLSLRHTDLIAPLVKAMQEQQATIAEQAKAIQAQQSQIEELRRQVQILVEARNAVAGVGPVSDH